MPSTSAIAAAIAVEGLLLQVGNGASPESYSTICNVSDITIPLKADTVDVTNVGDQWHRRIATLLDMGTIKFKIFWVMREPSHQDLIVSGIRGIRYLMTGGNGTTGKPILANWQAVYPDGNQSVDNFAAYVTAFSITGKVGGVFEAEIDLANNGTPILV